MFPKGFTGREGEPFPLMVRKSDGGFGYSATDLAAIRYRIKDLKGRRLLYVIGSPQAQHLDMVFAVAQEAGWLADGVVAQHVAFGSILGEDGKMLRSRRGQSVKLIDLLNEAVAKAAAHSPATAEAVGIGAIKYADLSSTMIKDYVFDFDRMLSLSGDTSVYLQYTHARACSVLQKAASQDASTGLASPGLASAVGSLPHGAASGEAFGGAAWSGKVPALIFDAPQERTLALELLAFAGVVETVAAELEPHKLTSHLRNLAVAFTAFYDACPVLRSEPSIRDSRLVLVALTARVLACGLHLLGIAAPPRM